jgi:glycosyltransferase involved in cell wall biosynthesis
VKSSQSLLIEHISVVIITKNAEQHLEKCLNALHSFREVIFLDSGSTDNTLSMAAKYANVKIYHQEFKALVRKKIKQFPRLRMTGCSRSIAMKFRTPMFSKVKKSSAGVRGADIAFSEKDILTVNGFDNNFTDWGREDSEFCARMLRNGILRRNLKLGGVAYHLYHPESSREKLGVNDSLLEESLKTNRLRVHIRH